VKASERVHFIKNIATRLATEDWPTIDLTLKQFHLPTSEYWEGNDRRAYVIQMVSDAEDDTLRELAAHVGIEIAPRHSVLVPSFWQVGHFRLFLSHLAKHKTDATELQQALMRHSISAFVAHRDIEPTKEWEDEILLALSTADALVALLKPDFHASNWTDQEIGFALGRGLLVVSVRQGVGPYGFLARHQALQGRGMDADDLSLELLEIFRNHKQTQRRMADALVDRFEHSSSFSNAKANMGLLEDVSYWEKSFTDRVKRELKENNQISDAFGVPARIQRLLDKHKGA